MSLLAHAVLELPLATGVPETEEKLAPFVVLPISLPIELLD